MVCSGCSDVATSIFHMTVTDPINACRRIWIIPRLPTQIKSGTQVEIDWSSSFRQAKIPWKQDSGTAVGMMPAVPNKHAISVYTTTTSERPITRPRAPGSYTLQLITTLSEIHYSFLCSDHPRQLCSKTAMSYSIPNLLRVTPASPLSSSRTPSCRPFHRLFDLDWRMTVPKLSSHARSICRLKYR